MVSWLKSRMKFINLRCLATIDLESFCAARPFPWASISGFLTEEGFEALRETLPPLSALQSEFGRKRGYGQASHDRYALQYRPWLDLSTPWREFIAELEKPVYLAFLRRLYGIPRHQPLVLTMHWHYAGPGCAVSPHVDASRKIGSHIFYFNDKDWDPGWGGETLVLDDEGRFDPHSAPCFNDFKVVAASKILGNKSFIFHRTRHSWHGVRPLSCPPDRLRKIFIVVLNRVTLQVLLRRLTGKDADGYPLH